MIHRSISEAERRFLLDGIDQGLRNDGRGCFDYRRVSLEVGTIPTATGSCRLRAGETDILVGVSCDIVKPSRETPDEGRFHISVELAASVSVDLVDSWYAEDAGQKLSVLLESLCAGNETIDRKALCVTPGVFAWEVHADVVVFASGGNLLDSVSLALCAALGETLLPKVEASEAMEEGERMSLTVDDRPEVGSPIPLRRLPLCVTVAQLRGPTRSCSFLLDATPEEELCAEAMISVVVDAKSGAVVGLHKLRRGLFDVASLPAMLDQCRATAAALAQQLEREAPPMDVST